VKRHFVEIVAAILLCLAAFFGCAAQIPISLPFIETGSSVAPISDVLSPALVSIPKLRIMWPQFQNFCVGLCTREEYPQ